MCFGMPEVYRVLFEAFGMDPEDESCQPKLRRQLEDVDYVSVEFEGKQLSWQEVAAYKVVIIASFLHLCCMVRFFECLALSFTTLSHRNYRVLMQRVLCSVCYTRSNLVTSHSGWERPQNSYRWKIITIQCLFPSGYFISFFTVGLRVELL